MRYEKAEDLKLAAEEIVNKMGWFHINLSDVGFLRSFGSSSRNTVARCHAMGKAMQLALDRKGFYLVEFISERFDKLSKEDQTKVIIHELMHIPKTFGGGFVHHNKVNDRRVEEIYREFKKIAPQWSVSDNSSV
jgi:predicted metallopeptidase